MAARRAGGRARPRKPPDLKGGGAEDGGKALETESTKDVRYPMASAPTSKQRYKPRHNNETNPTRGQCASHADAGMGGARYPPDPRTRVRWTLSRRWDYRHGRRAAPARGRRDGAQAFASTKSPERNGGLLVDAKAVETAAYPNAGVTRAPGLRTCREPDLPVSKHRGGRADREP